MFNFARCDFASAATALHAAPARFYSAHQSTSLLRWLDRTRATLAGLICMASKIGWMIDPLRPEHQELLEMIDNLLLRLRLMPGARNQGCKSVAIVKRAVTISLTVIWLLARRDA